MSKKWLAADMPSLKGRVAVVTGANSGLGLETVAGLAAAGAEVVMACRSTAKAEAALQLLRQRLPEAQLHLMQLDLSDLGSVRGFAAECGRRFGHIDLLCNNAGVMALPYQKTRDGFEMQIGTNHFGHFALTGLLLEQLKAAPAARIVTVASVAHRGTKAFDLDDPHWERTAYRKNEAYARSKLANLLFTFELSRRLKASRSAVAAVAAHPGYSATGIVDAATAGSSIKRFLAQVGNALIAQPADRGALPSLYAASMADMQSGEYIGPHGFLQFRGWPMRVNCSPAARDEQKARGLWALSEQLTGVRYLSS
ncbi:MAG: oxidoreductase [Pseudomonadota bacterium]